jgi:vanillate O-demethylase ferredoxin subunit
MPEAIEWRDGMVRATRDLTPAIRLIEIEPSGGFVAASPGSHINVSVMIRGRPDVRSYSIVGPCADRVYRIAVKRLQNTRGGSAYMWTLRPGARIALSAPGNHFHLALGRSEYLLLAGGIGVTPIFTHALALAERNARFRLLYACRSRGDLALADELAERLGDRLELFLSEEGRRVRSECSKRRNDAGARADGRWIACASRHSAAAAPIPPSRSSSRFRGSARKSRLTSTRPCSMP